MILKLLFIICITFVSCNINIYKRNHLKSLGSYRNTISHKNPKKNKIKSNDILVKVSLKRNLKYKKANFRYLLLSSYIHNIKFIQSNSNMITKLVSKYMFNRLFPSHSSFYNYNTFIKAVKSFPNFVITGKNLYEKKRELAAFLAQTAHETGNFKYKEELNAKYYTPNLYCSTNWGYKCVNDKSYHGRGPIQLSWNYNYQNAGKYLNLDLLHYPELVSKYSIIGWKTALWFWMIDHGKGSIHSKIHEKNGFAISTYIINGGLECQYNSKYQENELNRIKLYKKICYYLNIVPEEHLSCRDSNFILF